MTFHQPRQPGAASAWRCTEDGVDRKQNGVFKNRELAAAFGAGQVLGATALVSGEVPADGSTRLTSNERLFVGELAGGTSPRSQEIAAALRGCGIAADVAADIGELEWAQYTMFVPVFCGALITRQQTHRFLSHPRSSAISPPAGSNA